MDKIIRSGYSRDQIVLDTPYPILEILSIEVRHELNDHGSMTVKAILEPDSFGGFSISHNDVVQLKAGDDDMAIVFTGKVYSTSSIIINEVGHLEFTAHTATMDMDFTAKSRSFQYHKMKYEELVQFVAETYDEGNSITTAALGEEIGAPIYQYEETDWNFLARIASSKGTVLTANTTLPSATFWFGVPKSQKEVDITAFDYTRGEAYETLGRPEYYYYEFQAREVLLLGDKVNLTLPDGTLYRLVVTEVKAVFDSDELVFHFRAEPPSYIKRHLCTNKRVKGITLGGTVIDVSRNHIKLHLDIDPEQDVGEAHWYPMAYESNQVWYAMPHVGEHINLCVTDEIHSGYGMTDVRGRTGKMAVTPVMGKPTEKYMQTKWGKTTALHEGDIEFDTKATNVVMDEESIHIFSNDKIVIDIEDEINLGRTVGIVPKECGQMIEVVEETKNITLEAEEMITFRVLDYGTAIELTGFTEYHTLLDLIHHDGTNKAPMPLLSSPGQEHDPATYKPPGYYLRKPEPKPPEPPAPTKQLPQEESGGLRNRWRNMSTGQRIMAGLAAVAMVAAVAVAAPLIIPGAKLVAGAKVTVAAAKAAAKAVAPAVSNVVTTIGKATTYNFVGQVVSNTATALIEAETAEERIEALRAARDEGIMFLSGMIPGYSHYNDARHIIYNINNWSHYQEQRGFFRHLGDTGLAAMSLLPGVSGGGRRGSGGNTNTSSGSPSVSHGVQSGSGLAGLIPLPAMAGGNFNVSTMVQSGSNSPGGFGTGSNAQTVGSGGTNTTNNTNTSSVNSGNAQTNSQGSGSNFNTPRDYLNEALRQQGLNNVPNGLKQPWTHGGYRYEVRVHAGNPQYTSAQSIYRVSRQQIPTPGTQGSGTFYLGTDGRWYHTSVLKPTSPLFDINAARITHIDLP